MDNPSAGGGPPAKLDMGGRPRYQNSWLVLLLLLTLVMSLIWLVNNSTKSSTISYGFFLDQLDAHNIAEVKVNGYRITGRFKTIPRVTAEEAGGSNSLVAGEPLRDHFTTVLSPFAHEDIDKLLRKELGVHYSAELPSDGTSTLMFFYLGVTVLLLIGMWLFFRRARDQILGGGGILSGFSKSPAKRYESNNKRIMFSDVAGLEGVKNDLAEVVKFLKNPEKFQRL